MGEDTTTQLGPKQLPLPASSSSSSFSPASSSNTGSRGFSHLCLDVATGELRRYGPTSYFRFVDAVESQPAGLSDSRDSSRTSSTSSPIDLLSSRNMSTPTDAHSGLLPPALLIGQLKPEHHVRLLNAFFTWINPWCLWVSRADFMASLFPNGFQAETVSAPPPRSSTYSEMLHLAMLAVASPLIDDPALRSDRLDIYTAGVPFAAQAKRLIEVETAKPMLSTVQALMLLASVLTSQGQVNVSLTPLIGPTSFWESSRANEGQGCEWSCSSIGRTLDESESGNRDVLWHGLTNRFRM
jgi:Fungal specific transcription factor domain